MAYEEPLEDAFDEGDAHSEPPMEPPMEPIDEDERQALQQDLIDVRVLKAVLGSRGIKGVVVYCPDCEDDHYLGWDLLAGNLQQILEEGEPPVHEPAWEPNPDEYVTWDYARGFLDGYETYPEEKSGEESCGYCGNALPDGGYEWAFCPSCGKDLAPINLIFELRRQGWSGKRIGELFDQCGFEPPLFDPDEVEAPRGKPQAPPAEAASTDN